MRKKPTRKRPYFKMESAMTAILRDASGKMHHGILFDPPLGDSCRIQCGQCYARCDWSLPINTSMTSRKTSLFFFLVFNMARGFENVCKSFPDYASKGHENSLAGAFYQKEKRRNREKESS